MDIVTHRCTFGIIVLLSGFSACLIKVGPLTHIIIGAGDSGCQFALVRIIHKSDVKSAADKPATTANITNKKGICPTDAFVTCGAGCYQLTTSTVVPVFMISTLTLASSISTVCITGFPKASPEMVSS